MKKNYIIPTLYVRQFVVNNILAGTPTIQGDDSAQKGGANVDGTNYGGTDGDGLAKESSWGSVWE